MTGDSLDLIVVGGGLAGLTAGLFAARRGLTTLVIESSVPGGHIVNVERIEDFPGFPEGVAGFDLGPMLQEQAATAGATFELAEVESIQRIGDNWQVTTPGGTFTALAVILAAGTHPRPLGIPGEDKFQGRGISHCASCDGPLFRGKTVGVVGSGDWALQEALTLATFAAEVIIFGDGSTAQHTLRERIAESSNITLRANVVVQEILGEKSLTAIRVRDTEGDALEVPLASLFVYVGQSPNSGLLGGLVALDGGGHVPTDSWMRTSEPGLFAAGDVRQHAAGFAITAAGDGATAAIAAFQYVRER